MPADAPRQKVGQPYAGQGRQASTASSTSAKDEYAGRAARAGTWSTTTASWSTRPTCRSSARPRRWTTAEDAPSRFKAPQPQLFAIIIEGILGGKLEWGLVIAGALIAIALELMGVSALPVAVGMYLGLPRPLPIFIGGLLRWAPTGSAGVSASDAESETSPGVLLASGYIAGGTLCGLLFGFLVMAASVHFLYLPEDLTEKLNFGEHIRTGWENLPEAKLLAVAAFGVLAAILFVIGRSKSPELEEESGR